MISINLKNYNHFFQLSFKDSIETDSYYDQLIEKYETITNFIISCPHCGETEYYFKSPYIRTIKIPKSNEKGKETLYIEIKRVEFKCDCTNESENKPTHALIPDFITPFKQHSKQFITEILEAKINLSYNEIEEKYNISKELLKFWKKCFDTIHKSFVTITEGTNDANEALKSILRNLDEFSVRYYKQFKLSFMQFTFERII